MLPDAFPASTAKPCRIESGKSLLQEEGVVVYPLSEKLLGLSLHQFPPKLPDKWGLSPFTTCRDIFLTVAASFISSSYVLRHEAQVSSFSAINMVPWLTYWVEHHLVGFWASSSVVRSYRFCFYSGLLSWSIPLFVSCIWLRACIVSSSLPAGQVSDVCINSRQYCGNCHGV